MLKKMNHPFAFSSLAVIFLLVFGLAPAVQAHCQIPCGIYDDHARVKSMKEDALTIEKSIHKISALTGKTDALSVNQRVRWVMNKEKHAQNIISAISDYFLTQRVKPDQEDYTRRLINHHAVIVAAMKAKQNAAPEFVQALKQAIGELEPYYPGH
ncbi:MAG: superoxide dismutase, Ni [Desulfobacterales bacterium]|nr:superoxide dismutase, Ni [Desulfobacterales bacterium]